MPTPITEHASQTLDPQTHANMIIDSDVVKPSTARAVVLATQMSIRDRVPRAMLNHIEDACRICNARMTPVAAALGWFPSTYGPGWVDATSNDPGLTDPAPCGDLCDLETRACALVFSLIGGPIECSYALPCPL